MIIKILLILAVTGGLVYATRQAPFIDATFKPFIIWTAVFICVVWCLAIVGVWAKLGIHW